jgi:glycerate kinase
MRSDGVRVLVASDAVGTLSSLRAGQIIASGWAGADVVVVAIGEAGAGFVTAFADQLGTPLEVSAAGAATIAWAEREGIAVLNMTSEPSAVSVENRSSLALGEALAQLLAEVRPGRIYLDIGNWAVADAGAGLLAALGATADGPLDHGGAGLTGVTQVDLGPARAALGNAELIGVVPTAEMGQQLFGLRGITSLRGRAAGADSESMLRSEAALEAFARLAAPEQATSPGSGAGGGLGFAVLALGGRLSSGPAVAFEAAESPALSPSTREFVARGVDLAVTGCSVFDFATRGGGVVTAVAERATAALSPCIVLAGEVVIGAREMRTMGIEAAYGVRETTQDGPGGGSVGERELGKLAHRVARSWTW